MCRYFSLIPLAVLVIGCAATETETYQDSSSRDTPAEISSQQGVIARAGTNISAQKEIQPSLTNRMSSESITRSSEIAAQRNLDKLNQQIALASANASLEKDTVTRENYKVGPGDVIDIVVFQVGELNKKARVSGDGYIVLPLLGPIKIAGKTTTEIQNELVERLAKNYLQDPHVSIFVSEYRSHQVAVLGAVVKPNIYHIQWPRTILEMLSKAGGLSKESGTRVRVQRSVIDEQSGQQTRESLAIDLQTLLIGENADLNFLLFAGDSIMVPRAGSLFVEGAVAKPGAYRIRGKTNVLKALTLAGGVKYQATNAIEVFRQSPDGESIVHEVNLKEIRSDQSKDLVLEDGDIVVVKNDSFKKGMAKFWNGFAGIFSISITRRRDL